MTRILEKAFGLFAKKQPKAKENTICLKELSKSQLKELRSEIDSTIKSKARRYRETPTKGSKELVNLYAFYKTYIMKGNTKYQTIYKRRMIVARNAQRVFSAYVNKTVKAMQKYATKKEQEEFDAFLQDLNKL